MTKECKIIEFAGLAGCGKTTLVRALKEKLINDNLNVITLDDIDKKFKYKNFVKIICSINIIELFSIFKLFCSIKYNKNRIKSVYGMQIKLYIFYKFCKKYSNYDYALIDHGMVQNFISFMFNSDDNITVNKKYLARIQKIFSFVYPDLIFRCNIDEKTSNERMKIRGRKVSTIEKEMDESKRLKMINKDKNNFDGFFDYCKKNINVKICCLDMNSNENQIFMETLKIITNI